MKKEVERIKKLVGIDHNRWEQPCTCDKCKNMCKVSCIGTPKDIEAIIDAGYADRLKETMWMVGYLAVKEKPIAMIQPTEKDGWCVFRRPDGLCELHDRGLKPTEGVLASCKMIEEDNVPTKMKTVKLSDFSPYDRNKGGIQELHHKIEPKTLQYWGEDSGILIGITPIYKRHLWSEEVNVINDKQ